MKVVFNNKDLIKELKTLKPGKEILFYNKPMKSHKEHMEFQKYLYDLITMSRLNDIEITGAISFKKIKVV